MKEKSEIVYEYCSKCEREAGIRWKARKDGYKAYCPHCGEILMICGECMQIKGYCDWDSETGRCRFNKPKRTNKS